MKKKIKKGDYIRDTAGGIGLCVLAINEKYSVAYNKTSWEIWNYSISIPDENYIVKSSKNIVDLLQIGDIITLSNAEDKPLIIYSEDMIKVIKIRSKK